MNIETVLTTLIDAISTMNENTTAIRESLGHGSQPFGTIEILHDNKLRPLYLFYLHSGCRKSEALSIRWADVDYTKNRIRVRGTKTAKSNRYIPLFDSLKGILYTQPKHGEYVFPYAVNLVNCNFKRMKSKHGLTFRIHDLRHTFATRCLENGIAYNTVQKWLGHARASTTLNIYSHVHTTFEREEIDRYNQKLSAP